MTDEARKLTQFAPWPSDLEAAVAEFRYLEGWRFWLEDGPRDFADPETRRIPIAGGLTFFIFVPCMDSYHPERYRPVHHLHPVPAATFNRASWERWILARLLDTLTHEATEHARFEHVVDHGPGSDITVRRPWAPLHGPGDDPYVIHDLVSSDVAKVSFLGKLNEGDPLAHS